MATDEQLTLLQNAKIWYVDATFKCLRRTDVFDQLFGIHTFVKKEDHVKQVPLVFVFISRRRKKDYTKVLKKIKTLLVEPEVQAFVMDFEAAIWSAVRSVFQGANITGCAFRWSQTVRKKIQACWLATEYNSGGFTQKILRRLLALPLLPEQHIETAFMALMKKFGGIIQVREVFDYVQSQWFKSQMWTPKDWSVYGQLDGTEVQT